MTEELVKRQEGRSRIGNIETDAMRGDNLGVLLASVFESWCDDGDEMDETGTWKQKALDQTYEVLDAIHAIYAARITALSAEVEAMTKACDSYADENQRLSDQKDATEAALASAKEDNARLREALEWYAEQAAGCRKLGRIGDPARQALDADGGNRARTALGETK